MLNPFGFNFQQVLSGCNLFENGKIVVEDYGPDLDELNEGDRVGVMRTSEVCFYNPSLLLFSILILMGFLCVILGGFGPVCQFVCSGGCCDRHSRVRLGLCGPLWKMCSGYSNDESEGGKPFQAIKYMRLTVIISHILSWFITFSIPALNTAITTSSLSGVDSNQEDEDSQQILVINGGSSCVSTPGSISSSASVGIVDRLRFHHRCGTMVKLSAGQRTAERRRPLDEFNNGVVMTQRPLMPDELFEIRIDNLVDKWSGSIEVGITTHNPQALDFPSTMTNLRSGTVCAS